MSESQLFHQRRVAFGLYEADLATGELWKGGFRIKLQGQPFKVLTCLLERPGQVVTREELQLRLWGRDTVVDFDHSIGTAVNKIREALSDSAENPRFVETLARRGYRFIAPVSVVALPVPEVAEPEAPAAETAAPPEPAPEVTPAVAAQGSERARPWPLAAAGAGLLALSAVGAAGYFLGHRSAAATPPHIVQLTHNGHFVASTTGTENLAAIVTSGPYIYAASLEAGQSKLTAVEVAAGLPVPMSLPSEVEGPSLGDISPDGAQLLLREHLSPDSEQSLWIVPTIGGSAQRVSNVLAHDATWMPESLGGGILYASGNDLYVTHMTDGKTVHYASLPGRAFWLRWSPSGKLLRFTLSDPIAHTRSLWQLTPPRAGALATPQRLLTHFATTPADCCGSWLPDGSAFVFESQHGGSANLWELRGNDTDNPIRLTDGPLQFESPVADRTGHKIYFLGVDSRSQLQRVTPSGDLTDDHSFLFGAVRVDFSRDGKWVAWTDTDGHLWRARDDGSEKLRLSPEDSLVFLARWSPDGKRLAVMARDPGQAWHIYTVSADGGEFQPLLREARNAADPSWSPDGQSIVFGRLNDTLGKESGSRSLQILRLTTGALEPIPESDGLFSPRWSPDGKYIAALTLNQREVRLFDVATHSWRTLPVGSGADPVWSADSRTLYVHAALDPEQPIDAISIPDGKVTSVVRLAATRGNDPVDFVFGGLAPGNVPLIRTRVFTGNLYSLQLPQ